MHYLKGTKEPNMRMPSLLLLISFLSLSCLDQDFVEDKASSDLISAEVTIPEPSFRALSHPPSNLKQGVAYEIDGIDNAEVQLGNWKARYSFEYNDAIPQASQHRFRIYDTNSENYIADYRYYAGPLYFYLGSDFLTSVRIDAGPRGSTFSGIDIFSVSQTKHVHFDLYDFFRDELDLGDPLIDPLVFYDSDRLFPIYDLRFYDRSGNIKLLRDQNPKSDVEELLSKVYSFNESVPEDQWRSLWVVYDRQEESGTIPVEIKEVSATSTLTEPNDPGAYLPAKVLDGLFQTGWFEDAEGAGIGESLTIVFDQPTEVDQIWINNGWFDSRYWAQNNRIKQLTITTDSPGHSEYLLSFEDIMQPHRITFSETVKSSTWTFTITDVYQTSKWDDTGITEIEFWLKGRRLNPQLN
jgi:hypothetical protein